MTHVTTYQQITKALTVLDIAQPIVGKFDKSTTIAEFISVLGDATQLSGIVVVTESERPFAFITLPVYFENEDQSCSIDTKAKSIDLRAVLSSNVSLYELLPLWRHSYHYFILDGAEITHLVNEHHMNSAPVKIALFAMTAEFEALVLQLLMRDASKVKERFEILCLSERQSIEGKCKREFPKPEDPPLNDIHSEKSFLYIQHTLFSQKIKILKASPDLIKFAFPDADATLLSQHLDRINEFRNGMAHGRSLSNVVKGMKQLNEIVDLLESTIIDLRRKLNELPVVAVPT